MNLQAGPARQWPSHRATLASGGGLRLGAFDVAPSPTWLSRWAGPVCCGAKLRPMHSLGITQIFSFFFSSELKKSINYSNSVQIR